MIIGYNYKKNTYKGDSYVSKVIMIKLMQVEVLNQYADFYHENSI